MVFLSLGKAPGDEDVTTWLIDWLDDFRALESNRDLLSAIINYVRAVSSTTEERLLEFAAAVGPQAEEITVTTAEQLRAEGEARGEARGEANMLLRMLSIRFGDLDADTVRRVENATPPQIAAWSRRFAEGGAGLTDVLS